MIYFCERCELKLSLNSVIFGVYFGDFELVLLIMNYLFCQLGFIFFYYFILIMLILNFILFLYFIGNCLIVYNLIIY